MTIWKYGNMSLFFKNKLPPPVKKGGRIGIVATAGPVTREELEPGIEELHKAGFDPVLAKNLYYNKGYLAGTDEDRAAALNEMMARQDIQAVFCARGGYGSMRLLSSFPFGSFGRKPKFIIGYSDVTAILNAVLAKTGVIGIHGPSVRSLGNGDTVSRDLLINFITNPSTIEYNITDFVTLAAGIAKGRLVGGNLTVFSRLIGTPFMPPLKNSVLFLEDTNEPVYRIDRMITHLILSKVLTKISGIILGRFTNCGENSGLKELFSETARNFNIPCLMGLEAGHEGVNLPLPIGAQSVLDCTNGKLTCFV